jgi:hypothetical protein
MGRRVADECLAHILPRAATGHVHSAVKLKVVNGDFMNVYNTTATRSYQLFLSF